MVEKPEKTKLETPFQRQERISLQLKELAKKNGVADRSLTEDELDRINTKLRNLNRSRSTK